MRLLPPLLLCSLLLGYSVITDAAQYRSRELKASSMGKQVEKSIEQLEAELGSIADDYGKASTARYLARHFSNEKYYSKAARRRGFRHPADDAGNGTPASQRQQRRYRRC